MAHLLSDEIERYQREGWVVPQWRLPEARVVTMRAALDELLRRNPGVRPEKLVSAHVDRGVGDNGEGVRGVADFLDLARDPEIVELVSGVIGDDVILWGCHVFCKPAGVFSEDAAVDMDVELAPGQMSLHDVHMIHGAGANTSPLRRTGVALRYMPASSHFDRSLRPVAGQSGVPVDFSQRPLWLLKGRDACGLNDFDVGHTRSSPMA